jgi:hypothetical protein
MITPFHTYKINNVADYIIEQTGCDIFLKSRKRDIVEARSVLIYVLRKHHLLTYSQIQQYFQINGMKIDHATCIHAFKSLPMYMRFNKALQDIYDVVKIDSYEFNVRNDVAKSIYELSTDDFKRLNNYIQAITYDESDI